MKKFLLLLTGIMFCLVFTAGSFATPITYAGLFNSNEATVVANIGSIDSVKTGYFWQIPHGITQVFGDTGMVWATNFNIEVFVPDNLLKLQLDWNFSINGQEIGEWSLSGNDGNGLFDLSYTFPQITNNAGFFTIAMLVDNNVLPGKGSITLGKNMNFTLFGDNGVGNNPVPEPTTILLFGAGLLGLTSITRKKIIK